MITKEILLKTDQFFGLSFPTTLLDLKRAYRKACISLHPDRGGSEEDFKQMQATFDLLIKAPEIFSESEAALQTQTTVEGIPLNELGLGLGPTTNGLDCPECNHNGYKTTYGRSWKVCDACENGFVPLTFPCKACKGTGKFTQKNTRRVVDCRVCQGTGRYKHPRHMTVCPVCLGSQTVYARNAASYYTRCSRCNGRGEIPMWNPVLLKGALSK